MYNSNARKSVFPKNIAKNFLSNNSSGITEVLSQVKIENKEIIECASVSTGNVTLSGSQSINGITTGDGDIVLINAQTTPSQNGIYVTGSGVWERIGNNINEISLVLIIDGDLKGNIYYLDNKPVVVGTDDINYIAIRENRQLNILTTTYNFDETDIIASISSLQTIIPAVAGYEIMPITATIIVSANSLVVTNPAYLTFTNGSYYTFRLNDTLLGDIAPFRANLMDIQNASFNPNYYASGDDWGLYSPALIYTSGSITGKIIVTYCYVES